MTKTSRLTLTLAALLALAPLAAEAAPTHSTRASTYGNSEPSLGAAVGQVDYSALLGLEFPPDGMDVGPRLTGEIMYSVMDLAPKARLKLGVRGAFGYHGFPGGSFWLLDAVPDAKITLALTDLVALYGDVGLGLAVHHVSVDAQPPFPGGSDSTLTVAFQMGGGVAYAINPRVNLLGEIRLDLYTRSGSSTFVSFPTVGLQFH
ncbi:outer membrane beta-barrel protein [Anaeromyxobacter diazotrophicus]|uniref:Outer membrane protein beta-barrel domain-containing protein n=1 Tax=Anaeromyxobacter diazotrophicus TaxID=2590199 RepID=A0A7I9VQC0_9BACT|nr:outer membrane beta-barrel protein [Anaeromyxobacter diazotrophicus]GEJ58595.1 hypothetical protein AMYX_33360 [Anaeromyxobacter diazotrophicus]